MVKGLGNTWLGRDWWSDEAIIGSRGDYKPSV